MGCHGHCNHADLVRSWLSMIPVYPGPVYPTRLMGQGHLPCMWQSAHWCPTEVSSLLPQTWPFPDALSNVPCLSHAALGTFRHQAWSAKGHPQPLPGTSLCGSACPEDTQSFRQHPPILPTSYVNPCAAQSVSRILQGNDWLRAELSTVSQGLTPLGGPRP